MALEDDQWAQIRRAWEYDPDQPTYAEAGKRAGLKYGFTSPAKQVIARRAGKEGWERKGVAAMADVASAAHRKADKLPDQGVAGDGQGDGVAPGGVGAGDATPGKKAPLDASAAVSSTEDAEDLRAAVLKRHRSEWTQVAVLRQEALLRRPKVVNGVVQPGAGSVADAFEAAKLAKITAEMTAIQQAGERKAWGLDVVVDPDQLKTLSEADLVRLAQGKPLKGV